MTTLTEEEQKAIFALFNEVQHLLMLLDDAKSLDEIKQNVGNIRNRHADIMDHLQKVFSMENKVREQAESLHKKLGE
tara:strand:+ start:106 stop:336 length:231 start_codon:yes stop_codon:yes gene_type:complete